MGIIRPSKRLKYGIIVNPKAGRTEKNLASGELDKLSRSLDNCPIIGYDTKSSEELRVCATEMSKSIETIVVAGGDGTMLDVINGVNQSTNLYFFPSGTFNALRYSLNLTTDEGEAYNIINRGKIHYLDLIELDQTKFLFAGVGYDARVVKKREKLKSDGINGSSAYWMAIIDTLIKDELFDTEIESREGHKESRNNRAIFFSKISHYGPRLKIFPELKTDDGLLHISLQNQSLSNFTFNLSKTVLYGDHIKKHIMGESYSGSNELNLTLSKPVPIHIHGNLYPDRKSLELRIIPKALKMIF